MLSKSDNRIRNAVSNIPAEILPEVLASFAATLVDKGLIPEELVVAGLKMFEEGGEVHQLIQSVAPLGLR